MKKLVRLRMALLVPIVALSAACSDALGPEQAVPTGAVMAYGPGRSPNKGKSRSDKSVTTFTVNPRKDESFTIGGSHLLTLPAHAICDPERSSYGIGTWNDPCEPLEKPIRVTVTSWRDADGLPRVHFEPKLRFAPSTTVQLRMTDRRVKDGGNFSILFCTDDGTECVDESISDPSLQSFVIQKSGTVYRRIKHFSVYNLAAESWGSASAGTDSY